MRRDSGCSWRIAAAAAVLAVVGTAGARAAPPSPPASRPALPEAAPAASGKATPTSSGAPATRGAPPPTSHGAAAEPPIEVHVVQPKGPVKLGDPFEVVVQIDAPGDVDVRFPARPYLGKRLRLLGVSTQRHAAKDGGKARTVVHIRALALRTRAVRWPPIEFAWLRGQQAGTARAPGFRVHVQSRLAAETAPALRPAPGPVAIPVRNLPLLWGLSIAAVALLTALLTWWLLRVVGPRLAPPPPGPPPRPAHEVAWERLDALAARDLPAQGRFLEFYFELTEILREYFQNRYQIPALGDTSSELVDEIRRIGPKGITADELAALLGEADLVKFAKVEPSVSDAEQALVLARLFVDRTREAARVREPERPARPVPAPSGMRLAAALVDGAIAVVLGVVVFAAWRQTHQPVLAGLVPVVMGAFVLFRDVAGGASPGKAMVGLRVVAADPARGRIGAWNRVARNLPLLVPLAGVLAEFLWLRRDAERRRIGDYLAGTAVTLARAAALPAVTQCVPPGGGLGG